MHIYVHAYVYMYAYVCIYMRARAHTHVHISWCGRPEDTLSVLDSRSALPLLLRHLSTYSILELLLKVVQEAEEAGSGSGDDGGWCAWLVRQGKCEGVGEGDGQGERETESEWDGSAGRGTWREASRPEAASAVVFCAASSVVLCSS